MIDIDNVDMGSGLFMPFYFSYPYRFNYGFLKNFFYPFGLLRGYKTAARADGKQFSQSTESFNSNVFSAQAGPEFFTKGSTADFEKALDNTNSEAYRSAYERYFTDISKNFSLINKTSDILKTTDYQKSYLYSNMEAFEKNFVENLTKDLYKSNFTSLIEQKNAGFSNLPNQVTEFTNGLTQIMGFTNPLTQITGFTNGFAQIAGFSNPLKTENFGYLGQLEVINSDYLGWLKIINSVLQSQSEKPAFLKTYESALNIVSTFNGSSKSPKSTKSPNFGIASGFSKSDRVSIFPNFKTENTPYKSIENFTAKAAENQWAILQNLSKQEQNFYLYEKGGNTVFQSPENSAEKNLELAPLKFSPKSRGKSLEIGEQNPLQKPCQATPEKILTSAGIDLDSLLEMICSALEEELNTCAEGVHF